MGANKKHSPFKGINSNLFPNPPAPRKRWHLSRRPGLYPSRSRWQKVGALIILITLGAVIAITAYEKMWPKPIQETAVILVAAGYEDNPFVPHNVYGKRGLVALNSLATKHIQSGFRLHHQNLQWDNILSWDQGFGKVTEKNILIFLSLHGGVDKKGAYLLPHSYGISSESFKLRLKQVLNRLAAVPEKQNILLILEATGRKSNHFADELEKLNPEIKNIPNLVVISSSDRSQQSWPSFAYKKSIFSHFLIKGLKGNADANEDNQVHALELFRFVSNRVQSWVARNRGASQSPVLFPKGPEGETRARKIKLASVLNLSPQEEVPNPSLDPPRELQTAWELCRQLEKQIPSPQAYSPALWRSFRDSLLRYEQLVIAGETQFADKILLELAQTKEQIEQNRKVSLTSLHNNFHMHKIAGYSEDGLNQLELLSSTLWNEESNNLNGHWRKFSQQHLSKLSPLQQRLACLHFQSTLLQRASANPNPPLDRTRQILQLLEDPFQLPPGEAHFLNMLAKYLPRKTESAPSQFLLPGYYRQMALQVRLLAEKAALGIPDKISQTLYTEEILPWIQPTIDSADQQRRFGQDLLFAKDQKSWDKALEYLQTARRQYRSALATAQVIRHALNIRDQVQASLPYYLRWADKRSRLNREGISESNQSLVKAIVGLVEENKALVKLVDSGPPVEEKNQELHLKKITKQIEKVRSLFKAIPNWFPVNSQQKEKGLLVRWHELDSFLEIPFSDPDLRTNILRLRHQCEIQLLKQPVTRKLPQIEDSNHRQNLSRLIKNIKPRSEQRKFKLQRLLTWLATRTYRDHWQEEVPGQKPYFQVAARKFLEDAEKLHSTNPKLRTLVQLIRQPSDLGLAIHSASGLPQKGRREIGTPLPLSSEREIPLTFQLSLPRSISRFPSGYAVVSLKVGKGLKAIHDEKNLRHAFLQPGSPVTLQTIVKLNEGMQGRPLRNESQVTLQVFFRGRTTKLITPIAIHSEPETAKPSSALPATAKIAIRASKEVHEQYSSPGNVVIILDCSGSMGPPKGETSLANSKFLVAIDSLHRVLQSVPKGTNVSVWTFGKAIGERKTVKQAEQTIERIFGPSSWNPQDPEQLQDLMNNKIARIEPWNETPLVRTMIRAAREDLSRADGLKTILVITDGIDNRIHKDSEFNSSAKAIPELLRANFKDVKVNVVGFKIVSREQVLAKQQFSIIEQLPRPGKFYEAQNAEELLEAMLNALQPKLQFKIEVKNDGQTETRLGAGKDLINAGATGSWVMQELTPGEYQIRVTGDQQISHRFTLGPAHSQYLELRPRETPDGSKELGFFTVPGSEKHLRTQNQNPKKDHISKDREPKLKPKKTKADLVVELPEDKEPEIPRILQEPSITSGNFHPTRKVPSEEPDIAFPIPGPQIKFPAQKSEKVLPNIEVPSSGYQLSQENPIPENSLPKSQEKKFFFPYLREKFNSLQERISKRIWGEKKTKDTACEPTPQYWEKVPVPMIGSPLPQGPRREIESNDATGK